MSKLAGESENNLRKVFEEAEKCARHHFYRRNRLDRACAGQGGRRSRAPHREPVADAHGQPQGHLERGGGCGHKPARRPRPGLVPLFSRVVNYFSFAPFILFFE